MCLLVITAASATPCAATEPDVRALPTITQSMLDAATIDLRAPATNATHELPLNETAVATTVDARTTRLNGDILFDFGSATLRASAITKVGELSASWPRGATVTVTGHTDSIGSEQANLTLSRQRAEAVAAILRARRSDLRLTVSGKGESEPVASNGTPGHDNPAGRAQNRRVDISVG